MSTPLRPLSTGEVLDRTFSLYRKHFLLFTGIGTVQVGFLIVGVVVFVLVDKYMPSDFQGPSGFFLLISGLIYAIVILLFYLIGYALATSATISAVSRLHLGAPATIRGSYREVRPLAWRMLRIVSALFVRVLGALLLPELLLALIGGFVVPYIVRSVGPSFSFRVFRWIWFSLVFGFLLGGCVWAIRTYCRYSLAVPACLLEKLGARQALKRSKVLSKRSVGRIFLVFFLMTILGVALNYILQIPAMLFSQSHPGLVSAIWQLLAAFVALSLAFPIGTISVCLLYYDLRVRKEAFDLQLMMEAIGQKPPEQSVAASPLG